MSSKRLKQLIGTFTDEDWKRYAQFAKMRYSEKSDLYRIQEFLYGNRNKGQGSFIVEKLHKKINPIVSSLFPKLLIN